MTKTFTSSPRALMAIAAVLAAVSSPALSQDMPAPAGADPAPVAAPEPALIVIPPVQPAPTMTSAPVVQAIPAASVTAPTSATTAAAPNNRRASPTAAKPVRAGSTTGEAAAPVAAVVGIPVAAAPVSQVAAPALPVEPASAASSLQPAAANDSTLSTAALAGIGLGGLALAGLLGAGALRRRRHADDPVEALPELAAATAPPSVREPMPEPAVNYALASSTAPATASLPRTQPVPGYRPQIPAGPLPTDEAMVTLFNGLVAAAPDAANPFVGVKRRGRRVRWLLRQHQYRLREAQDRGFDFRSFTPSAQPSRELLNA